MTIAPNAVGTGIADRGRGARPTGAMPSPRRSKSRRRRSSPRATQAGWVGASPLSLDLPTLPHGAHDAHVDVSVLAWRECVGRWLDGTTCACIRIAAGSRSSAARWRRRSRSSVATRVARCEAVVQEALDNAAAFQSYRRQISATSRRGELGVSIPERRPHVPLTAYTVQAFALLRSLGYPVQQTSIKARGTFSKASTSLMTVTTMPRATNPPSRYRHASRRRSRQTSTSCGGAWTSCRCRRRSRPLAPWPMAGIGGR